MDNRETFWELWRTYCKPLGIDPCLEEVDFQTKTRVATGFSGRVPKGSHGRGKQVQVVTVRASLVGVNANISLDTGQQPLYQPGSNNKYILPLQHMLKGFENKYPPQVKKSLVHPEFPDWLCKLIHNKGSSKQWQFVAAQRSCCGSFSFCISVIDQKTSLYIAPTQTRDISWCPGLTQPRHHNVTSVYLGVSNGCPQCTKLSGGPNDIGRG